MIVIDQEEVKEVSSDLPGGIHARVYVEIRALRKRRKYARKHRYLYPVGKLKLGAYAFILPCYVFDTCKVVIDLLGKVSDVVSKLSDLVI